MDDQGHRSGMDGGVPGGQAPPLTPPPGFPPPAFSPGWGQPPGYPPPPPGPGIGGSGPPRGFLRRNPLLVILIIFGAAIAALTVAAIVIGMQSDGLGAGGVSFGDKVGVIEIEGVIFDSRDAVKEIQRFSDDGSIKAVVVRIDSPGGVVGPSQEIYSELRKLAEDKPVVVSMGAVAASGGYYVACPAKVIFANPGTITGSIGVVMEMANLEGLFEWMKVKQFVIKSGPYKDIGSSSREMTKEEREILQAFVDNVHAQFEAAIAKGRKLDPEKVHALANGNIYTGEQAKELGLVDELGTLWDAIDRAAELAGIEGEPKVVWPTPKQPNFFDLFSSLYKDVSGAKGGLSSPVRIMYIMQIGS